MSRFRNTVAGTAKNFRPLKSHQTKCGGRGGINQQQRHG